jgi:hypothetical protein
LGNGFRRFRGLIPFDPTHTRMSKFEREIGTYRMACRTLAVWDRRAANVEDAHDQTTAGIEPT